MYSFSTSNATPLFIPEEYINVKTGETHPVSPKIREQIEYHTRNRTLTHLVMSALHHYLERRTDQSSVDKVLQEIYEMKELIKNGISLNPPASHSPTPSGSVAPLDTKEVEDILDAFGG